MGMRRRVNRGSGRKEKGMGHGAAWLRMKKESNFLIQRSVWRSGCGCQNCASSICSAGKLDGDTFLIDWFCVV